MVVGAVSRIVLQELEERGNRAEEHRLDANTLKERNSYSWWLVCSISSCIGAYIEGVEEVEVLFCSRIVAARFPNRLTHFSCNSIEVVAPFRVSRFRSVVPKE